MDHPTELTAAQRDRVTSHVREWLARAWCTTPLTENEWQAWEAGMRRRYAAADRPWPAAVVRVGSPVIAAQAAPIALIALRRVRRRTRPPDATVIAATVTAVMGSGVDAWFAAAVHTAACAAVRDGLAATPPGGRPAASPRRPLWVELPRTPSPEALRGVVDQQSYQQACRDINWRLSTAVDIEIDVAVQRAANDVLPWQWSRDLTFGLYGWAALTAFFAEELSCCEQLRHASRAQQDSYLTRWWWPTRDFVMVCDRPVDFHVESSNGRFRLHNASGPAIRWADGWSMHFWHGTPVPGDLIQTGWSAQRILAEHNAEVRRCAIERMGWDRFASSAELTLLDQVPDPANPGQWLRLYELPATEWRPTRVLVCANATRERDGTRHHYGLGVPADCGSALAAAAWTFNLSEADYAALTRAT